MFVALEIWRTLFSCYLRFEIRPSALPPTNFRKNSRKTESSHCRHSKIVETPLVIYNSLRLCNDTESLATDHQQNLGLGVTYLSTLNSFKFQPQKMVKQTQQFVGFCQPIA